MAEPHTSSFIIAATAAGIGLSTLFPGIDGNALIGAFAGSSLVAISSKNLSLLKRLAYMLISLVAGYLAAPEVVAQTPLRESGVAAFLASAAAIALTFHLLDLIKKIQLPSSFEKGKPRD
ncbi:putative holin [Solimicrobium silvestre]|uniref:Phage holin n=1 Tax=Solimicrobium silvestre TaxID=2099400 RepID=A0A2S9GT24_9BURK|nr:putative holin [Solimicrobium silvestre]PRC90869.1 hypothetical protein S2091_4450 [Solimicrobium silvestre]